eukprot:TCONS_00025394-protein
MQLYWKFTFLTLSLRIVIVASEKDYREEIQSNLTPKSHTLIEKDTTEYLSQSEADGIARGPCFGVTKLRNLTNIKDIRFRKRCRRFLKRCFSVKKWIDIKKRFRNKNLQQQCRKMLRGRKEKNNAKPVKISKSNVSSTSMTKLTGRTDSITTIQTSKPESISVTSTAAVPTSTPKSIEMASIEVSIATIPPPRAIATDLFAEGQRTVNQCYFLAHDEQGTLCVTENNCITYTYPIFELHCV